MIAYLPLIAALLGVLMYALSSNAKVAEIGRLMYFAGLLVFMFSLAHKTVEWLR